jgi:hypothetical protein
METFRNITETRQAPLPSVYSEELRGIVDAMLHKDQRSRPSARNILENPLIVSTAKKILKKTIARAGETMPDLADKMMTLRPAKKKKRNKDASAAASKDGGAKDAKDGVGAMSLADDGGGGGGDGRHGKVATGEPMGKCAKCSKQLLAGNFFVESEGDLFHAACLTCALCETPLLDGFTMNAGKVYCDACEKKAPKAKWTCEKATRGCGQVSEPAEPRCTKCARERVWMSDAPKATACAIEGALKKRNPHSTIIARWQQRYFTMHADVILYYKKKGGAVCGLVPLETIQYAVQLEEKDGCRFDLVAHARGVKAQSNIRTFELLATSRDEASRWVELVKKLSKEAAKHPSTFDLSGKFWKDKGNIARHSVSGEENDGEEI